MVYSESKRYDLKRQIEIDGIFSVLYYEFTKDFNFFGEAHDYWEFVYVDKGEVITTAEKEDIFLKQGEIIFHKPNEFHRIRSNGIIAPNVIVVSFRSTSKAMNFFKNKRITVPEKHR